MASSKVKDFVKKSSGSRMPEIPEELLGPDGRPLSMKPRSPTKADSSSPTPNTTETSPKKTRLDDGLVPVPRGITTSTVFDPNIEYKAVPSVLEYTIAKGRSRVSMREATPEEAEEVAGQVVPVISEVPELVVPALQPRNPPISTSERQSQADSVRTSTTEIRMSTASSQSDSSTMADEKDESSIDLRSNASTLLPYASPSERIAALNQKPSMLSVTHSIPHYTSKTSMRSHASKPSDASEITAVSAPVTMTGTFDSSQSSRFSWHESRKDRTGNWFTRWFIDWWALEILSWCFSVVCMIIIVAVLLKADGKPLPRWNLGVSVNAFISIFSGFAKSALLLPTAEALGQLKWTWFTKKRTMIDFEVMDSASRGPIGSLMLLMRSKGITLASVGAAIILLSLPLDLFFQQIVAYPEPYLQDMFVRPPTIARSIWYDPDVDLQQRGDDMIMTNDFQIESILTPYWSKLGQYPRANILLECPTSNCTFDPFYTLALDFQCAELPSETLEFGCQSSSSEWLSTVAYEGPYTAENISSCGWYLNVPDYVPQLMSGYELRDDGSIGEVLATRVSPLTDVYSKQQYFNGSISFPEVKNPVVDFVLVSTPDGFEGALRNNTPVIHECEIHWVINEIFTYITHGTPVEQVLSTKQFKNYRDNPWDPNNPNVYQANFSMTLPDTHALTEDTSTFGLSNSTARKVWQSWAEFAPSAFIRPASNNLVTAEKVLKMSWLSGAPPHNSIITKDLLPWDAPNNVTNHMAQAILAMNTVMRNNVLSSANRKDAAYGRSYRYVTVVDVRWAWISLPATLLLFAGLFLLATILRARKDKNIGVWKTSALAVLFNGPGEDVQKFVGEGEKTGYVRNKARDMEVQLGE